MSLLTEMNMHDLTASYNIPSFRKPNFTNLIAVHFQIFDTPPTLQSFKVSLHTSYAILKYYYRLTFDKMSAFPAFTLE